MAGTTITTISPQSLTLSGAADALVTIAVTGGLEPAAGPGIFADLPGWSLANQGEILGGSAGIGVYLAAGAANIANQGYIGGQSGILGSIALQNTGMIEGRAGPGISGAGSIVNRGTILGGARAQPGIADAIGVAFTQGTLINGLIGLIEGAYQAAQFSGAGMVVNLGTMEGLAGTGVVLAAGGNLVNGSGTDPAALIYGDFGAVSLGGTGTVVNYGRLLSRTGSGPRNGIGLGAGGTAINHGTVAGFNGIYAGGGMIENDGTILGGAALSISIPFTGYAYLAGAGVLLSGGTLENAGFIRGGAIPAFPFPDSGTAGAGVTLGAGYVHNAGSIAGGAAAGGTLTGGSGVLALAGSLVNTGQLTGGAAYYGGAGLTVMRGANARSSGAIQGGAGSFGGAGVLLAGGTLLNTGSIEGGDGTSWNFSHGLAAGVDIYTGLLVNEGIVTGGAVQHVGVDLSAGTLVNGGTILGNTGVLAQSGLTENYGQIIAGNVGVDIIAGTLRTAGIIAGRYAVYLARDAQLVQVEPGASFYGSVTAKDPGATIELCSGAADGTLDMGSSFSGFAAIAFDPSAHWTLAGGLAELAGGETITGFTLGDTLALEGFSATSAAYLPGMGLELSNGTASATIAITGGFAPNGFMTSMDAAGTRIAICYARGTRIWTTDGERPVERLDIGDELPTLFAGRQKIKWIGRQNFTASALRDDRSRWPVRIGAGALGPGLPRRALTVSPGHSMFLGGKLVLARLLVNGITITQERPAGDVAYYLIELPRHDCLRAEGAWSESFADGPGLRAQLHNAAEYHRLYPHEIPPQEIVLCAPRPLCGPGLEAALRPIVARAAQGVPGALRGFVDIVDGRRVEGWAQDEAWPELPQMLELSAGGRRLGRVLACDFRPDLAAAGIGTGHAHFVFTAPRDFAPHDLRVRRAADGAGIARA